MNYGTFGKLGYLGEILLTLLLASVLIYLATSIGPFMANQSSSLSALSFGYRWLSPVLAIPGVLVGLAWLLAGRERKVGLFTATGAIGLASAAGGVISQAAFIASPLTIPSTTNPSQALSAFLALFGILGVLGVLGFVFFVLEIVSLFTAATVFQVKSFRYAGWGRILAVIGLVIVFVILGILFFMSVSSYIAPSPAPQPPSSQAIASLISPLLVAASLYSIIWTIPNVFAYLGFRRIVEAAAAPAGTA